MNGQRDRFLDSERILDSMDRIIGNVGACACSLSAVETSSKVWFIRILCMTKDDAQTIGRMLRVAKTFQEITIRPNGVGNWILTTDWMSK